MAEDPPLPSLSILFDQVASERQTMNDHAESLDAKAGVVLGFAGVLVGLGATAQQVVSERLLFQFGLGGAVISALLAAWAFIPRGFPVLQVQRLRDNLTAGEDGTKLELLDTQIDMVVQARQARSAQGSEGPGGGCAPCRRNRACRRRYTDFRRRCPWLKTNRPGATKPVLPLPRTGPRLRRIGRTGI